MRFEEWLRKAYPHITEGNHITPYMEGSYNAAWQAAFLAGCKHQREVDAGIVREALNFLEQNDTRKAARMLLTFIEDSLRLMMCEHCGLGYPEKDCQERKDEEGEKFFCPQCAELYDRELQNP